MLIKCDRLELGPATPPCGCRGWHGPSAGLNRRNFLRGASAVGLAAALPATAMAQAANVVDVHHHYTSPALLAMMKGRRTRQGFNEAWTLQKSLDAMDAGGIATAVVSTSDPGVFFGDYDQAKALARDCNEYQARMVTDHKGRPYLFNRPVPRQASLLCAAPGLHKLILSLCTPIPTLE